MTLKRKQSVVPLHKGFSQVCVWPGIDIGDDSPDEFESWFKSNGFNVQYLETITTAPDRDANGYPVEGTGGRHDIFFAIADNDVCRFALPRLQMGIRWIEDVLSNVNGYDKSPLYPERVFKYKSWEADCDIEEEDD